MNEKYIDKLWKKYWPAERKGNTVHNKLADRDEIQPLVQEAMQRQREACAEA